MSAGGKVKSSRAQQQQQQQHQDDEEELLTYLLTVKPHAFAGAILPPNKSHDLTPSVALELAATLSNGFSRKAIIPYTLWITEAWQVLGWAEPSAALFWEMATVYHTLYLAGKIEASSSSSEDVIPPILSCGSHSSMGSAPQLEQQKKQKFSSTAKELPVWLIGTFLLLHCEESSFQRSIASNNSGGNSKSGGTGGSLWQQKNLATRVRTQSSQQDQYTGFLLRHLRKILLLIAVPHNEDAVNACAHFAQSPPPANTKVSTDLALLEKWHQQEHGSVGVGIRLTMEDMEKLHFVMQPPSGGGVDDMPLDIGKYLWDLLHPRSPKMSSGATLPLGDVEREIRRQLQESYQRVRPEESMSKLSLEDSQPDEEEAAKRGYHKELSYTNLRGTTIILKPESSETHRLHDLVISDCSDAHFYLLQPFEHVTISFCTGCTIVVGAVAGLLHVVDCEKTELTSAARRLLVSNSTDVLSYIFTPSPPLLVGDNRNCQLGPYNTFYEGLRDDLLATGLAAAVVQDAPPSPSSGATTWPLQCASNKWKQPVELSKLEIPQADDDSAKSSTDDSAMQTPVLLPTSAFNVLFVPLVSASRVTEAEDSSGALSSQYCERLAQVLQLSPFRLPVEYERQALVKADRMRNLQSFIKTLSEDQQARIVEELNRGFRDWLVTSGNLRQVLDLVHLERSGGV